MKRGMEIFLFVLVFLLSLFLTFPREQAVKFFLNKIAEKSKLSFSWERLTPTILGARLRNLTLKNGGKSEFKLDTLEVYFLGIGFSSVGTVGEGTAIVMSLPGKISYSLEKFPLPPGLGEFFGKGALEVAGDYDIRKNQSLTYFALLVERLPAPFSENQVKITGEALLESGVLNLRFALASSKISGKGQVKITMSQGSWETAPLSGEVEISMGSSNLKYKLQGSFKRLEIVPSSAAEFRDLVVQRGEIR